MDKGGAIPDPGRALMRGLEGLADGLNRIPEYRRRLDLITEQRVAQARATALAVGRAANERAVLAGDQAPWATAAQQRQSWASSAERRVHRLEVARKLGAWAAAQTILARALPLKAGRSPGADAQAVFRRLIRRVPLRSPDVAYLGEEGEMPGEAAGYDVGGTDLGVVRVWGPGVRGYVGELLWHAFRNPAREFLKRCRQCGRWFVDVTPNKKKQSCSADCTWKFWSRDRRRVRKAERYLARRGAGGPRARSRWR